MRFFIWREPLDRESEEAAALFMSPRPFDGLARRAWHRNCAILRPITKRTAHPIHWPPHDKSEFWMTPCAGSAQTGFSIERYPNRILSAATHPRRLYLP
jgi:hypothetical protein